MAGRLNYQQLILLDGVVTGLNATYGELGVLLDY